MPDQRCIPIHISHARPTTVFMISAARAQLQRPNKRQPSQNLRFSVSISADLGRSRHAGHSSRSVGHMSLQSVSSHYLTIDLKGTSLGSSTAADVHNSMRRPWGCLGLAARNANVHADSAAWLRCGCNDGRNDAGRSAVQPQVY